MEPVSHRPQVTPLLPNDCLERLQRLRIATIRRFTDKSRGEHLAGRGGRSVEFSDYRDYVAGDDIRFVDWNVFARLHRPYLKLYRQEEEMHVVVLVDASASMTFEGKLDRAKELAAAFGVMGLWGTERVSVWAANSRDASPVSLPPCRGRASMMKLFSFAERIEGGGDAPVDEGVETLLKYHAGRGVAVVLSDFLTFGDLRRSFNLLFGAGLEILAVQILGPSEREPEVTGDVRLVDAETSSALDVSATADLLGLYLEHLDRYERELARLSRERGGRFVSTSSEDPLRWVLFDLLLRRGWMA
jgi:uncharacterized protein (DUF58 family)